MEMDDRKGTKEGRKKVFGLWYKMSPGAQKTLSKLKGRKQVLDSMAKDRKPKRKAMKDVRGASGQAMGVHGLSIGGAGRHDSAKRGY